MSEEPNMDFLAPLYDEELNSAGDVEIVGSTFQRSRILNELEKVTYDVAFQEWVELRRQSMLDRANQILSMYDNRNRFNELKSAFRGPGVVPFIGAGMSMPSGYPGWTTFLWDMQAESHVSADDLNNLLSNGEYESAAQLLYDDLGPVLFNRQLQECYAQSKKILGAVHFLPLVFPSTNILTTNFDFVLEDLFRNKDQGFDQVIFGNSLPEVLRLFHIKTRMLVKIHGTCNIVANRVLLRSEYERAYADAGSVKSFFSRFMFAKSLFFLGCSLTTDRTLKAMEEVVNEEGASTLPSHYAFLELKASQARVTRKKMLAKANILPIWYPENEHDESVEALLIALMED